MRHKNFIWVLATCFSALCAAYAARAQTNTANEEGFGGGFGLLQPEQQRLVEDWFKRFSAVVQKPVDAEEGYAKLPLSVRTTFNAVTDALLKTSLTDESGRRLAASALDIVDKVDTVAGQIEGAGGDRQFRIYIQLKPDALALLDQSTEFSRTRDNTRYHHGYPVCYRSTGGTPSIQVSLTPSAARGDIDVDYRSSKFPAFLVNGHLTVGNSDVRAGDNYDRHISEWTGLQNWWRNLLGLPIFGTQSDAAQEDEGLLPRQPREKLDKPADAVFDFLNTWLVEQKPDESIPYFAQQAFACLDLERGAPTDRGMAKFTMLNAMQAVNRRTGKISSLSDASIGVRLTGERGRVIGQPHQGEFVLYDVREDLAEQFNCLHKLEPSLLSAKALKSKSFGKYVGAVFRLKALGQEGETVATLWQKENDYWKLISFEVEPDAEPGKVPDLSVPVEAAPPLPYVAGDRDMIRASEDFFDQWLRSKNIEKALRHVAPQCLDCVNLYRSEDAPAPSNAAEARELLKQGMASTAKAIGTVRSLEDAIVEADFHHQDLRLVHHKLEKAFTIVAIPEYMADSAKCAGRKPGEEPEFKPQPATGYGKYYATGFSRANAIEDPSVLWIVWGKMDGQWKAVSYTVLSP